jgi:hypothetical protein
MNRYNNPIKVPTVFDSISGKNAVIDSWENISGKIWQRNQLI